MPEVTGDAADWSGVDSDRTPPPSLGRLQAARLRGAIDHWFDLVWRTLRGLGVPAHAADDAAQRVFLTLAGRLAQVPVGKERSFLVGTAVRVAANDRRVRGRRREDPIEGWDHIGSGWANPEEILNAKQAFSELERILGGMPNEQRTAFVLFELEGFTMAEIAETLAIAPGTVASRLRSARRNFEQALAALRQRARGPEESP